MDYWQMNLFVDERCADIRREIDAYRMARQATSENGWFAQSMLSLGFWLVTIGEDLCRRYDISKTKTALNGF